MPLLLDCLLLALGSFVGARLARALRFPPLLGMIGAGMLFAAFPVWPEAAGFRLAAVSSELRLAVLAVVLLRAGLGISTRDLRQAGGLGLRFGIVPLLGDALAVTACASWLLDLPQATAAALGFLVAAISPAIVIPALLDLLRGRPEGPPRRVLTALLVGAPLDNILALVAMGLCLDLALAGHGGGASLLLGLGLKIVVGIALGAAAGWLFGSLVRGRQGARALALGSGALWLVACALIWLGNRFEFSFVLALLTLGMLVRVSAPQAREGLDGGLLKVWGVARYLLFALIGAAVPLGPLAEAGLLLLVVVLLGQLGRGLGSLLASAGAGLEPRQRLACALAYVPKATIQAAFAALALDQGLAGGELILSAGVLAVVVTAPLGVITLHRTVPLLLGEGSSTA